MQRLPLIGLALAVPLAAFVYVNNTSLLSAPRGGKPTLLAHRGLHQTFPADGLKADTCTAARIHPPEHGFLENTIPSMQAAFEAGADVVELDVLPPTATSPYSTTGCWTVEPTARA
jgi:glycerophosphoryl diester phosphodiesterase